MLLEDGVCYDQCLLLTKLLAFALLHSVLQGQICLILQVSLDFLFCIPFPYNKNLFWVLVLEGLVSLHRIVSFNYFSITCQGIDLDYCDIEWFALETNRYHSVVFETASKYCISDSFVDHDGYSVSSKGFLSTVVDIMI